MSWLLYLLAALVLAFLLAPSLFKSNGAVPVAQQMYACGGDITPTQTETLNAGGSGAQAMNRLVGSRSGYMGVIR